MISSIVLRRRGEKGKNNLFRRLNYPVVSPQLEFQEINRPPFEDCFSKIYLSSLNTITQSRRGSIISITN